MVCCSQIARNAPTPRQHFSVWYVLVFTQQIAHTATHGATGFASLLLVTGNCKHSFLMLTLLSKNFFIKHLTFTRLQGNIPTPRERRVADTKKHWAYCFCYTITRAGTGDSIHLSLLLLFISPKPSVTECMFIRFTIAHKSSVLRFESLSESYQQKKEYPYKR